MSGKHPAQSFGVLLCAHCRQVDYLCACLPSSSVSAPPAADADRPAVPEGQGKATTAPRANQGGAA